MKQFFKFVFASCLGSILALFALMLIFVVIGAIASAGEGGVGEGSVLLLELDEPVPELSSNISQQGFSLEAPSQTGLREIVKLLDHAKNDASISGIVYKTSSFTPLGMATASTIREALKDFRDSSDKFVYTYGAVSYTHLTLPTTPYV